jgi:hypothetical protein
LHHEPESSGYFQKKSIMNIEQQDSCIDSIVSGLMRTGEFRGRKAKQYDDPRNVQAVESLKILAKNAAELRHDYWNLLSRSTTVPIQGIGKTPFRRRRKKSDLPTNPEALRFLCSG